MNQKITEILEKHEIDLEPYKALFIVDLNNAIIEICEEQKLECSNLCQDEFEAICLLNSKNIAE
jgi:hypothetical protein